jgi:hypothetical protein
MNMKYHKGGNILMSDRELYLLDLLNNDPDMYPFAFDIANDGTDLVVDGEYIRVYAGLSIEDDMVYIGGFEVTSARGKRLEYYDFEAGHEATDEIDAIITILEELNGTLLSM